MQVPLSHGDDDVVQIFHGDDDVQLSHGDDENHEYGAVLLFRAVFMVFFH